jgi:hypothetical protein
MGKREIRVFEVRALGQILGPKRDWVTRGMEKTT